MAPGGSEDGAGQRCALNETVQHPHRSAGADRGMPSAWQRSEAELIAGLPSARPEDAAHGQVADQFRTRCGCGRLPTIRRSPAGGKAGKTAAIVVFRYRMAQPRCSVCLHPKKSDIDAALMAGDALIPTGQRFGVSKSALARHRTGCLAPKVAAAAKMVATASVGRAEVVRAKAITSGLVQPLPDDILSLTGLLGRLARSLERLEAAADASLAENLPTALAAVSGQLHRGIEAAAKMQGLYVEPHVAKQTFSITFSLGDTATDTRDGTSVELRHQPTIDGAAISAPYAATVTGAGSSDRHDGDGLAAPTAGLPSCLQHIDRDLLPRWGARD